MIRSAKARCRSWMCRRPWRRPAIAGRPCWRLSHAIRIATSSPAPASSPPWDFPQRRPTDTERPGVMVMTETVHDVVVVGGGGSGLAAAIEARRLGREVVLIEKNPQLGGSTAWSIGSVSASATPHQLRRGIKDRPEDHWRDMAGFNGALDPRDNPALRRVLADAMPDTFRWLLAH